MFKGKKWKKLHFNSKGVYFISSGTRVYLGDFMRADNAEYDGYLTLYNFGGIVVKISDNCEAVKVAFIS